MKVKCNIEKCEYNKNKICNKNYIEIKDNTDSENNFSYCASYKENIKYIKEKYHIERLPENQYDADYLVIINNCNTGQDYIKHIIDDIPKNKEVVTLIFDHLFHNGNNNQRYILTNWNFKKSCSLADGINVPKKDIIQEISAKYFKKKPELIENSILTSVQKKMILKGIVI